MKNENKTRLATTITICRAIATKAKPAKRFLVLMSGALLLFATSSFSSLGKPPESDNAAAILTLLNDQTAAWNRGDIESFMNGYWNSDQTEFVSGEGVARGWQALLNRYHHAYPDRKAMGHLSFSNLEIHVECATAGYAIGEYHLQRESDNPSGVFTLNFRKFPEGWRIVVDHTTAYTKSSPDSK